MKKIFALLLATAMLMCMLTACFEEEVDATLPTVNSGSSTKPTEPTEPPAPVIVFDENVLLGAWDVEMACPEEMYAAAAEQFSFLEGIELDITVKYVYEFCEDGLLKTKLHEDELEAMMEKIWDGVEEHLRDGAIYKLYEDQGMSKEDIDNMLETANMTTDDLVDMVWEQVQPVLDAYTNALMDSMVTDEDGYINSNATYTLEDNVLTINEADGTTTELNCAYDGDKTVVMTTMADGQTPGTYVMVKQATQE